VTQVAVIAARVPFAADAVWQLQLLRDLARRQPVVEQPHGLVVHIFVEVALLGEIVPDPRIAANRPVVLADQRLGAIAPAFERLVDVFRPVERASHHRAAERQQVVEIVRAVFRQIQQLVVRHEEMHFGRRFAVGRHLEFEFESVDAAFVSRRHDEIGRTQ
jgi:hypothetical protein